MSRTSGRGGYPRKDFEEPISENADKVSKNAEKEPVRVMVDIRMTNGMQIRQRD